MSHYTTNDLHSHAVPVFGPERLSEASGSAQYNHTITSLCVTGGYRPYPMNASVMELGYIPQTQPPSVLDNGNLRSPGLDVSPLSFC